MKSSLVVPIAVAIVLTNSATFFITKSVTSNSESQVVAYLKEKEAKEKAVMEKTRSAAQAASNQAAEARRKFLESRP